MLNKIKLTDAVVASAVLPRGKNEAVIWDTEVTGFGLRLRAGARTYILTYRPRGKGRAAPARRVKIGTPETVATASDARKIALTVLGKVASGGDPAAERAAEKRRKLSRVSDLLDRYERDLTRRSYVHRKTVMSTLRRGLAKHRDKDIGDLRGVDYAAVVDGINRAGKNGAAEDFRSRCRAFLSWCTFAVKVIDANPLLGYRRQRATRADRLAKDRHGRALADHEIAAVWKAASVDTVFGRYIRFLILTGCRRGEGAGLRRSMINRRRGRIELPAIFVKQGRGHNVAISKPLAVLLDRCVVDARDPDLVFSSARSGGIMSGWTKLNASIVKESGVRFTLHDLRRTFRTGLTRLGVDTETAELALGHAREDLIEIYERGDGSAKVDAAFHAWAAHVEKITAEPDVFA